LDPYPAPDPSRQNGPQGKKNLKFHGEMLDVFFGVLEFSLA
jgi:hypothetical protein